MYGEYRKRKEKKRNKREGDEGGKDRVCARVEGGERERGIGVTQGCVILSWPRLLVPNEETSEL